LNSPLINIHELNFYRRDKHNKTDEAPLQQSIADILTIRSFVDGLVPIVILLAMGSYSDRAGKRSIALILPLVGYIVQAGGLIIMTQFTTLNGLSMSLVSALIRSLSGGELGFVMAGCSYISDKSDTTSLSWNLGVFEGAYGFGIPVAYAIEVIYSAVGIHEVYTIGTGMMFGIVGLLFILFKFEEKSEADDPLGSNVKEVLTRRNCHCYNYCSVFTDVFETLMKKRPRQYRRQIWLLILAYACICGPMFGEFPLLYLFLRERLSWTLGEFSYFQLYVYFIKSLGKEKKSIRNVFIININRVMNYFAISSFYYFACGQVPYSLIDCY